MAVIRMLLFFGTAFFTLVKVDAAPTRYDQRQEGDVNVHAQLENFLFVVAIPSNNNLLGDLALQALELKQQLISRSSSKGQESIVSSNEKSLRADIAEPAVEIIQINENHSNKGATIHKTEGQNEEATNVSNQQTIFSISNAQQEAKFPERSAKNMPAFEFPKSREEPAIIGYFVDARKILESKIEDEGRARNVVENVRNPIIESGRPGTTLKKQLLQKEEDIELPSSNADKNDVTSSSEDKQQDELILLGDEYHKNCGPDGYRDASGICHYKSTIISHAL
ncbi:hypothetical protein EAG_13432 [Camponotus floridanus]|uniref:Uncharacterized protein n=1 Tax=Camponotus floridanus TaxID=104421 RepID=E2A225_CAMFO|nr:uncharacterized protein LOC112637026 [Camponotus floridanus]EFN72509.1 hypothetical protein EAG_13432 [Camponotus floridanus]